MDNIYSSEFEKAIEISEKFDADDILALGLNYFSCGYKPKSVSKNPYFNHSIAIAFAVIGELYGSDYGKMSNYHKGIAYLSGELNISKRQVKVLRKQFSTKDGYVFKIPYKTPAIIGEMIELISSKESETIAKEYLVNSIGILYRELFLSKQYVAIMSAAQHSAKINDVYTSLKMMTKKVGGGINGK